MNGKLYKTTVAIAQNGAIITEGNGQNCEEVSVADEFARNSDVPSVPVQDVQINEASILSNGVANVPKATGGTFGVVTVQNGVYGIWQDSGDLRISPATGDLLKEGNNSYHPIVPTHQHSSVFYGLAKAAGADMKESANAVGTYTDAAKTAIRNMIGAASSNDIPSVPVQDVRVNGTSVLNEGIANVPVASSSAPGVVMVDQSYGIIIHPTLGYLAVNQATDNDIKAGTVGQKPIVPYKQHASAFYGLAKAAGDSTQSLSSNAVGTYTESAKSAISQMLNAPVTVSGTTPSITAKAGVQYVCGEVSTLTIVVPASGCIDVIFESGSTPTVLTVTPPTGKTMKWPGWFDPSALNANETYEISILNGDKGVVMEWT